MLFWKPQGRRITRIEDLRDGMSVEAIAYANDSYIRTNIKSGKIVFRKEGFTDVRTVFLIAGHRKVILGYIESDGTYDQKYNHLPAHRIHVHNKFLRRPTMANKLLAALKLNKEQRKLSKVGVYDENGNLTSDGQELLLNFLAKEHEAELVEMTKDLIKDKKKCKDEE